MAHPRDPNEPLPTPLAEAYAQARATGLGPVDAAAKVGLKAYRDVERRATFRERLRVLEAEQAPVDSTLVLEDIVKGRKQVLKEALAAKHFGHANEAMDKLEELYERYPQLRGDAPARASSEVEKQEGPRPKLSRLEKRMKHRAALSVVPEAEGA